MFVASYSNAQTMTGFSFTGQWYIEPGYAERMRELILPRLEAGKDPIPASLLSQTNPPIDAKLSRNEQYVADYFRMENGVAILPINGAMSRSGDMCSYGNESLMRWMDILNRDENTNALVLKINSPGGTVDSTRAFADAVKVIQKPVVAWTPFAASAAYYVASQCTEIVVEDQLVGGYRLDWRADGLGRPEQGPGAAGDRHQDHPGRWVA